MSSQTPAQSQLNQTEIYKLKAQLQSVIDQNKEKSVWNSITKTLEDTRSLSAILDILLVLKAGTVSPKALQKAQLIATLYSLSNQSISLALYISEKATSLADVAQHFYFLPAEAPVFRDAGDAEAWRNHLFALQPTSVLLGLIEADQIVCDKSIKSTVVNVLAQAINNGFRIDQDSSRVLVNSSPVMSKVDQPTKTSSSKFIFQVQRLQALVRDPQHIDTLIKNGFDSATAIARKEKIFFDKMKEAKMLDEAAARIHDQATTIEIRNEQTWLIALKERSEKNLPYVAVDWPHQDPDKLPATGKEGRINLMNLFRDMDSVECDDCSSVLSPAAYFVDLLSLLKECHATRNKKDVPQAPTLFSLLTARRPDLLQLELSCSNTNVLVPYIDLVNEVLESYASFIAGYTPQSIAVYNMPVEENPDQHTSKQPRNLNSNVYIQVLQPEVFPMAVFPYNQTVDTVRTLLSAAGTSRSEVIARFASDDRIVDQVEGRKERKFDDSGRQRLRSFAKIVNRRAWAAEVLDLQQEDFLSITKESFQPLEFWLTWQKKAYLGNAEEYRTSSGLRPTTALWGYKDENGKSALDNMQDIVKGGGLAFIKRQLLPRADITFKDLYEMLKTNFIVGRLVVMQDNEEDKFTGSLDEMRLRSTISGTPTLGTLTEDICFDLQSFIRLWKKLGWSITDTDAILSTLQRRSEHDDGQPPVFGSRITGQMLENMAAVKEIGRLWNVSPSELQPLWGNIHTNGQTSLYARKFLQPRLAQLDDVFRGTTDGKYMNDDSRTYVIKAHRAVVLASLGVAEKDLPSLLTCIGFSENDDLSLKSLSKLYRVNYFAKMLSIPLAQFADFMSLWGDCNIFETPTITLEILQKWKLILDAGWSLKEVTQVLNQKDRLHGEQALAATIKLMAAMKVINTAYSDEALRIGGTVETVQKISALLFDSSKAAEVIQLVEGKASFPAEVLLEKSLTSIPIHVPDEISSKISCFAFLDEPTKVRMIVRRPLTADQCYEPGHLKGRQGQVNPGRLADGERGYVT